MMKKLLLGLALTISSAVQAAPPLPDSNFLYVIGNGEVSVPPDRARIEVTVRASGPDHQKAFAQLQADAKAAMAEAKTLGVADKDIDAHRIGKSRRYESGTGPGLPELEQTVSFELADLDKAVALADRVMKLQSVHEVSSNFYVFDIKPAEANATSKAAADALQRAQTLAKLMGRKLGKVLSVAVEPEGSMRERFGQGGSFGGGLAAMRREVADHRVPNGIDFTARLYVIYALE